MVALESTTLLKELPRDIVAPLLQASRVVQFSDGQEVFKEGDPGDGVYAVKSGLVQISVLMQSGERHVFSKIPEGEIFGEMAVLDNKPRSATAQAEGDTELYFIPRADMLELIQRSPSLSVALVRQISGRLREFNREHIKQVLQAERLSLVGRFAGTIVHDLRNPLSIIGMASELACMEGATAEMRVSAQKKIGNQVQRINTMLNDILEFTRGNQISPTFEETSFSEFIYETIEEITPEATKRGLAIEIPAMPPSIHLQINPQRLARVVWNLIMNAADALPSGGNVTLRFIISDDRVTTEIEDSGKGIAPEILEHLFEAFATFGKPKGTGLGLSITRKIIQEHGGEISAHNAPGGGAVFSFWLPIKSQ